MEESNGKNTGKQEHETTRMLLEEVLTDLETPAEEWDFRVQLLTAAVEYYSWGWSLVPVAGKEPKGRWHRYKTERISETLLLRRLASPSTTGLAAVCGRRSNLVVIDFDGEVGAAAFKALREEFPLGTRLARSGSGGNHAFFAYAHDLHVKPFQWKGQHAGEIRGEGGIVVLPPSRHESGDVYSWIN